MGDRSYLRQNTSILLVRGGEGASPETFTIEKRFKEGGSSVCYIARRNYKRGILKEFYPQEMNLKRTADGQLVPSADEACGGFYKALETYVAPHRQMMEWQLDSRYASLASFIPQFEIYYGCDENGERTGSAYIWTLGPPLLTFDEICKEAHAGIGKNPGYQLYQALRIMESLTECVREMHVAGMLHRDIKPSNFGFWKRGAVALLDTIQLFDVDSICMQGHADEVIMSEGYLEPEGARQHQTATAQTDIYAIGATLFHAIVFTEETRDQGCLYQVEDYGRLRELVKESCLVRALHSNMKSRLVDALTRVLQRCLCARENRYENCEQLQEDLRAATIYLDDGNGDREALRQVERSLEENEQRNTRLAMQYHLYEHPLDQYCAEEPSLRVLVVGFDGYGQQFLDACLQQGQMWNKELRVTVLSDRASEQEDYLEDRPMLRGFFRVEADGEISEGEQSYGCIRFAGTTEGARDIIAAERPQYVFVSQGEDAQNLAFARALAMSARMARLRSVISYVCEAESKESAGRDRKERNMYPVYVSRDVRKSPAYAEIERQAFNMHLVWERNLNVDFGAVRKEFHKRYNYDACVSGVLAIRSKLSSVGIDSKNSKVMDDEAARRFAALLWERDGQGDALREQENEDAAQGQQDEVCERQQDERERYALLGNTLRNNLIWAEHRRWVAEKVCAGYRPLEDLTQCAEGVTNDKRNKRHICLVTSRPDQTLEKCALEHGLNWWDTAPDEELNALDALERMSVELHRMYVGESVPVLQQILTGYYYEAFMDQIGEDQNVNAAFEAWRRCLRQICAGDTEQVCYYKSLQQAFLRAVEGLPEGRRKRTKCFVEALKSQFAPVLRSMEYHNYKTDDAAQIDNIAFVITYSTHIHLVIPYTVGEPVQELGNVAAATVVNPERILYLCHVASPKDETCLVSSLERTFTYLRRRNLRAQIECVLLYEGAVRDHLETRIRDLDAGRIHKVHSITADSEEMLAETLSRFLHRRSEARERAVGSPLFAVEQNETGLSKAMVRSGLYEELHGYRLDGPTLTFENIYGCEMLEYIMKKPMISEEEMASEVADASARQR